MREITTVHEAIWKMEPRVFKEVEGVRSVCTEHTKTNRFRKTVCHATFIVFFGCPSSRTATQNVCQNQFLPERPTHPPLTRHGLLPAGIAIMKSLRGKSWLVTCPIVYGARRTTRRLSCYLMQLRHSAVFPFHPSANRWLSRTARYRRGAPFLKTSFI